MSDLIAMGELLIDFTPSGMEDGKNLFMQNAGGAVANVAAAAAGFGISTAFLGMVGNDVFGQFLGGVLRDAGVDISGLVFSNDYHTTLAFVHLASNGERDFSFYRKPGADIMYTADCLNFETFGRAKVFHFGSLSLTDEPVRSATFNALDIAKEKGLVISYDPNYRAPLWKNEEEARKYIRMGLEYADIVKISDEESMLLFGDAQYEDAAKELLSRGAKLAFITMGSRGSVYAHQSCFGKAAAYQANTVDTTGAGDCFVAAVLAQFIRRNKPLPELSRPDIEWFADFAAAAASLCVEKKGAIPAMPSAADVMNRMNRC